MLLRDLTIENYRSFEKYKLDGLARVNLLVGDNNCGKTSVLEAGFLLTSSEPLDALLAITRLRGESCVLEQQPPNQQQVTAPAIDGLFNGRTIAPGSRFTINGGFTSPGELEGASFEATIEDWRALKTNVGSDQPNVPANAPWMCDISWKHGVVSRSRRIWMATDGGVITNLWSGGNGFSFSPNQPPRFHLNSEIIPLAGWQGRELAQRWDIVLQSGERAVVVDRLRVLHRDIRDIVFLPGMIGLSQRLGGIMIELEGERRPAPLNSLGDGSQRLLTMAIALQSTTKGTLFIDEIDTGMHHSRLSDIWRMVIMAAKELEIQVFATTHSLDCIRALEEACNQDESLRDEVALFSIDRRMDEAVRYGGDELSTVVEHDIEVR